MSTLVRIIVTSILSILMLSCNFSFGPGIDGDRNVVVKERSISTDFNTVKVSQGLDLYITQSNDIALTIEADENLHPIIMTEVENGTLRIYTTENIRKAASRTVNLNIRDITSLKATSGSDVFSTNTIKADELEIKSTSGSDIKIEVTTRKLSCSASSGSDIQLSGITSSFKAEATSGSDIDASALIAEVSDVKASSGADISLHTSKELTAKASSGADIKYKGNPEIVNKSDSSSGSVRSH